MVYESRVKSMHTMNCFPGFGDTGGDMVFSQGIRDISAVIEWFMRLPQSMRVFLEIIVTGK